MSDQSLYKSVLDNSGFGTYICDADGNIIYANKKICGITGYSLTELVKLNINVLDPTGLSFEKLEEINSGSSEKENTIKTIHIGKNSDKFPVEITFSNVPDEGVFALMVRDISEDAAKLEELQNKIDVYETAHANVHLGTWELETNTDIVHWSKETYNLFYRDEKQGPPNYSEFIFYLHPEDRYEIDEYFQQSLITGKPNSIDFRTNPAIGPMRYMNTQYSCIKSNDQVIKIFGTNQDITSRVQAEAELKKREKQLSMAVKMAKIGFWEYDVLNDMFTFNDDFYSIFKTTAEKVGGYKLSSSRYAELFVHPEDVMIVGNEVRKALQTTDPAYNRRLKHRMIYSDGNYGIIEVRIFILKDNEGRTIKTYGVNQDITDRSE